jgi:sulfate adenylyltransferase subunit 1
LAAAATHHAAPRLRFLTAGSVDDGKSTLIGRLLFDSRAILADQLDHLQARAAGEPIDLSLLTDGLEAEREQGITIDVAYRYFATPERKFIIADAPGHEQYTRNMVTAAAGSDAAVVLVDITKLDTERAQPGPAAADTPPQPAGASAAGAEHRLCRQQARCRGRARPGLCRGQAALQAFAAEAGMAVAGIVPVSALRGDNVTTPLGRPGTRAPACCNCWNNCPAPKNRPRAASACRCSTWPARAKVWVNSRVCCGAASPRAVWPWATKCRSFPAANGPWSPRCGAPARHGGWPTAGQSAGVVLDRQLDVSRGDWLATPGTLQATRRFAATLAWLDTEAATPGRKYWLRHGNRWVQARLARIEHRLDIHTLQPTEAHTLAVNEIGEVVFELQQALPLAPYASNRTGGALIVVDPASHRTSGALLVRQAALEA